MIFKKIYGFLVSLYLLLCITTVRSLENTSLNSFTSFSFNVAASQDALFQVFDQVKQYHQKLLEKPFPENEKNLLNETETFQENTSIIPLDTTFEKTFHDISNFNGNTFENMAPHSELQNAFFTPISHSTESQSSDPHYSIVQNLFNIWVTKHDMKSKELKKTPTTPLT